MKHKRTTKALGLFLAVLMCVSVMVPMVGTAAVEAVATEPVDTLNGWTLGEGYSVTSLWVYEGSYALAHTGVRSEAVSDSITLTEGVTYYFSVYVRAVDENAQVTVKVGDYELTSTKTGVWETLGVKLLGDGREQAITVSATGEAYIDGVSLRPFAEADNMLRNASFDSGAWGGFTLVNSFEGRDKVISGSGGNPVSAEHTEVAVEPNCTYLYTADFYLTENAPWIYVDMRDMVGEVQLRGTKVGEWHTVAALWESGNNTSTPIRIVKELNWDNPNAAGASSGTGYVDNITFKKVTMYEDLIEDEGIELDPGSPEKEIKTYYNNTDAIFQYGASSRPGGGGGGYYMGDETHMFGTTTFTFTGTGFQWLSAKNVDCGIAKVTVDGGEPETVDLGNGSLVTTVVFEKSGLENKAHTVTIENMNAANRPYVPMDAIAVTSIRSATDGSNSDSVWKMNEGASYQLGAYYLHGMASLKLENNASAVANNGRVIQVEPHTNYFYSAWRLRPGSQDVNASIVIKSADGKTELAAITGTRYNQTMWQPNHSSQNWVDRTTAHWEQIFGFWNSGNNTEITVWAESEGVGVVYFDDITFNAYENRAALDSIFRDGDMEGFIPDAVDLLPTDAEKARVKADYEGFLANGLANFPVSFTVGSKRYTGFGTDFTKKSQTTEDVDGGKKTITTLTHTSGLEFRVESVLYEAYNAYDWTVYIANNGNANSPVISGLNAVDMTLEGEAPRLKGSIGDSSAYEPYIIALDGSKVTKKPSGGRGTQGDSSYFNFTYGDKGVLYAVGWPGQWTMTVDNSGNDANMTRLTAGQEYINTYLKPGEEIRTPLMAFVHYNGRNLERSTNLWRRWMIDCNMHKIVEEGETEEKLPEAAIFAATSIQWHEMTRATDENQIEAINYYLKNNIDLTFWWMDAGWYYKLDSKGNFVTLDDWGWSATGTWTVDESRFPSKMKDISDHAGKNGIKTLLWFEPERIANPQDLRTDGKTVHPDWVLSEYLLDMGNKDAVEWTLNRILTVMKEGGISMYREDFNCDPLGAWQAADAAKDASGKRQGITENMHIQGHLYLWDSILEEIPSATIDSCASGGKRNDLETMRRAVPLHKTDYSYGDRTWQQAVATDMTAWIPYIGTKANGESAADNNTTTANRYSLRTAIVGGMVLGYNTEKSQPIDWDIVNDITEEQAALGHLLYSDYYVLEDWSRNENNWAAWEYYDNDLGEGYVLAFRRSNADGTRTYRLRGLEKATEYKIWFEDANKPVIRTGLDLMTNGVEFNLPSVESSDILHIQKAATADADRALVAKVTEVSVNGQHRGAVNTTAKNGYDRFDIRFNMALRDTVLAVEAGKLEKNVTEDYKDTVLINEASVADLLAKDAEAVVMDYDVVNNILNVYVKSDLFSKTGDPEVTLVEGFTSDGQATVAGKTVFTYLSADGEWTTEVEGVVTLVESVEITGAESMAIGTTQKLTVKVSPVNAADQSVVWASADTAIATVDAEGNVTAVSPGKVRITATAKDAGQASGAIDITVKEAPSVLVTEIKISGKAEMAVGERQTLIAEVLPAEAELRAVTWSSSDESIATVDGEGNVTAVKEGKVKITARALDGSEVFGEFEIEVEKVVEKETASGETSSDETEPGEDRDNGTVRVIVIVCVAIVGVAAVAGGVAFFVIRKRKVH